LFKKLIELIEIIAKQRTNFGENIARKKETVVGLFQSAVSFDFLMNLYKLGLKLKLNKISNRRHHYISSMFITNS
jgi:hypothetical protein